MKRSETQLDSSALLGMDGRCTRPHLVPGDVIETHFGDVGVISEAHVVINGRPYSFREELPDHIEHGWPPSYEVQFFTKKQPSLKQAWWDATEFKRVIALTPAREYLPNDNHHAVAEEKL